ncbi:MAG: cytochrome c biogenesis protein CcdA [Desulfatibacillaceae bacterium]|nr:cytochrome c biogenesis protein CcdA [Desulfatibacillaceae bacterium]
MLNEIFLAVNSWMSGGLLVAALGCFAWGVISVALSPCHLASIPLIVGYVAGQEKLLEAKGAARYAVAFTVGLFITIALLGVASALLGRMLGEVSPYWTILVGAILLWVALDMLGVKACSMSSGPISRLRVKGIRGAFVLGLAYGVLSGSCTFGFIAPILAVITIQQKVATGILYIVLFGIGHCLPIAIAGSSAALVRKILENNAFHRGTSAFRKAAGVLVGSLAIYFLLRPFLQNPVI